MKFCAWNVRSLYRSGSLTAVARELTRYKLDLGGVQEVRWENEGALSAPYYNFFLRKGKRKSSNENRIFCTPQNSISS